MFSELQECLVMLQDIDSMISNLQSSRELWNSKLFNLALKMKEEMLVASKLHEVRLSQGLCALIDQNLNK